MAKLFAKSEGRAFPGVGQLKDAVDKLQKKNVKHAVKKGGTRQDKVAGGKQMSKNKMAFKMNKTLGQHLLKNPGIVTKIIQAADVKRGDVVLEIGPGTGNLTVQVCALARKVVAIEIDPRMAAEVKKRCLSQGHSNLEIKEGDALKTDYGQFHICIANLPYQISSPFLFKLISHPHHWRSAVLMFQKEFGERLVAQPGENLYCRLGVNTQVFCAVSRVCLVAAASFNPPPKVDSVVIMLRPRQRVQIVDYAQWDGMLRILFSRKRRTLAASLRGTKTAKRLLAISEARVSANGQDIASLILPERVKLFKELIETTLKSIQTEAHPEGWAMRRTIELSIEEFLVLQKRLHDVGIYFAETNASLAKADMFDTRDEGRDASVAGEISDDENEEMDD
eukprot:Blabericola_migrator_1__4104@NODE_224_length_11141_cov_42_071880_g190_i0_p2_GENE_NODE_224_length_11141_cov_42_071880_g190_i0NODE_224_length_11141_cov_42_071880_g190_i0_p2_ORF_typecomplete_len393_score65_90RrnaAD/PF00398_20/7_2e71PCMT/PF01135_19/1e12Methyltransf_31/PF13847_6/3_4e10MTS/PF05175_14/2_7e09Ubie_methyltran/PF01209_18/1_6e08Ubie_methyltran/PF01209_18/2_2e03Methyltransf_25/PF13649_6/1_3e07DOT1/PF08123_13/1_2e07N6_Mtase/PF02384_16/1_2e07PrmA/PF06325_13/6_4e07NodS/PF05401_11/2e05Methyltran